MCNCVALAFNVQSLVFHFLYYWIIVPLFHIILAGCLLRRPSFGLEVSDNAYDKVSDGGKNALNRWSGDFFVKSFPRCDKKSYGSQDVLRGFWPCISTLSSYWHVSTSSKSFRPQSSSHCDNKRSCCHYDPQIFWFLHICTRFCCNLKQTFALYKIWNCWPYNHPLWRQQILGIFIRYKCKLHFW